MVPYLHRTKLAECEAPTSDERKAFESGKCFGCVSRDHSPENVKLYLAVPHAQQSEEKRVKIMKN